MPDTTVFDKQTIAHQIELVVRQRNPHRHRDVAGPPTEIMNGQRWALDRSPPLGGTTTPTPHDRDTLERCERADQDGGRRVFGFGDDVDQVVNAVIQIDVRDPWRTV